jgi:hypothetical protein
MGRAVIPFWRFYGTVFGFVGAIAGIVATVAYFDVVMEGYITAMGLMVLMLLEALRRSL